MLQNVEDHLILLQEKRRSVSCWLIFGIAQNRWWLHRQWLLTQKCLRSCMYACKRCTVVKYIFACIVGCQVLSYLHATSS